MWGNWTRRSGIRRASPARPQAHRPKDPAPPRRSREAEQTAGAGVASANPHPRHDSISSLSRPPYAYAVKDRLNFSYKRLEENTSELQSLIRISYYILCLQNKTIQHKASQQYMILIK